MTQTYAADRTGLLIVDPYNDFMSKGGKLYDAIKPTADASGMSDNLRKLIPAIREREMQVFIVPHHRACDHDHQGWRHINMFIKKGEPVRAFEIGTWGGEFNEEFGPKDGDVIVKEHWAQSGFANTDLDLQLKQHGIEKIIVVGLIANSCIEFDGPLRHGTRVPRDANPRRDRGLQPGRHGGRRHQRPNVRARYLDHKRADRTAAGCLGRTRQTVSSKCAGYPAPRSPDLANCLMTSRKISLERASSSTARARTRAPTSEAVMRIASLRASFGRGQGK